MPLKCYFFLIHKSLSNDTYRHQELGWRKKRDSRSKWSIALNLPTDNARELAARDEGCIGHCEMLQVKETLWIFFALFHICTFVILRLWTWRRCIIYNYFLWILMQLQCVSESHQFWARFHFKPRGLCTKNHFFRWWNLWIFDKEMNEA